MRRTLTVLVTTAAFLLPAAAASAAEVTAPAGATNASCSNGKGGNVAQTGAEYSGKGNTARAALACVAGEPGGAGGAADPGAM